MVSNPQPRPYVPPFKLMWNRERLDAELAEGTTFERELFAETRLDTARLTPATAPPGWASLRAWERVLRHRARVAAFGPDPLAHWTLTGSIATPRSLS